MQKRYSHIESNIACSLNTHVHTHAISQSVLWFYVVKRWVLSAGNTSSKCNWNTGEWGDTRISKLTEALMIKNQRSTESANSKWSKSQTSHSRGAIQDQRSTVSRRKKKKKVPAQTEFRDRVPNFFLSMGYLPPCLDFFKGNFTPCSLTLRVSHCVQSCKPFTGLKHYKILFSS